MLKLDNKIIIIISLLALIFLMTACSDELPDEGAVSEVSSEVALVPIETVFEIVAAENDVARSLYTSKIVGGGQKAGLSFDEDWREADVQAGPLPALFLRESSASIQQDPVPLGLFLGSDFPISNANKFSDVQLEKIEIIRETGDPQFFFEAETELHTAMFKDIAVAAPCVECHNDHPETPKTDWEMGDIMGATTWTYPKEAVTQDELYEIITAVRQGFRDAYDGYIAEIDTFDNPPAIGEEWPSEEVYAVPSTDVFMARFEELASPGTLQTIMDATTTDTSTTMSSN